MFARFTLSQRKAPSIGNMFMEKTNIATKEKNHMI